MEITFDSSISTLDCQPINIEADDVEFDIFDDIPQIKEFQNEGIKYNPYEIPASSGSGGFLDCFG